MFGIACREDLHLRDIVRSHAIARYPPTFWQLLVFRPPFWILNNFSSFLPILRYFFWPCYHISQCFDGQFMNFQWKGARSYPTHCGRSWAQIGMQPGFQVSSFCKENPKWRTKIYTRLTRVSQWRSFQQFYWLILEFLQEWYQYSCVVFNHPFLGFNWGQSYLDTLVRPQICTKMLSRNLTFLVEFAYFASDQNFR